MPPAPRSKPPEKRPASPAEKARATRSLLFSVPGEHFQLVPVGEAVMCVARVSPAQALREPYATLSREQLGGLLYESGTPVVSGAALAGYLSSLHPVPAFDRHVPGRFAQDPGMSRLSQSTWRGSLGELSAQHQGWFPQQDLNAVRYNYPIFDLRDPQGGLNSVKTSVRVSEAGDPFATYLRGLGDVLGRRSGALERVRQDLYSHLPRPQGEAAVIRNGYISVNEDHVEPLRAALRDPANYQRQVYRDLADQLLEKLGPARVGGEGVQGLCLAGAGAERGGEQLGGARAAGGCPEGRERGAGQPGARQWDYHSAPGAPLALPPATGPRQSPYDARAVQGLGLPRAGAGGAPGRRPVGQPGGGRGFRWARGGWRGYGVCCA